MDGLLLHTISARPYNWWYNTFFFLVAGMAELVDAEDLKSSDT